ncbi:CAMKV isoform 9 [Pan troglodytes]|uniref:CaM kinase like vesicle associated n=2 Tax=Homininae TaxID=207598 RepID=B4DSW8_HUMAN|nr:CaM kinase like vesicle associated [Homo sapiens]KAI4029747.1 CaM kinase like vesicle associated [Homo sapiens]PNI80575.1 CAMKV isoform 9 [Pan troglodytes]BAG61780.1 unnamed protein product [Homo sapiens]
MPFGCVTLGDKKNYNQPSEVTDRYDLGQVIKTEEFCEIFRAKDKTTGKLHTCKKFQKRDGRKVRKAAKNEIGILKMVKHPNILQLVDVFVTRKEYFIFLELATTRSETQATWYGKSWRPWPICTHSRSCTGISSWRTWFTTTG